MAGNQRKFVWRRKHLSVESEKERDGDGRHPETGRNSCSSPLATPSVSIFIDNISRATSHDQLRQEIGRWGEVERLYISKKKRKNRRTVFAFASVKGLEEARRVIRELNGAWLNGARLSVRIEFKGHKAKPRREILMKQTRGGAKSEKENPTRYEFELRNSQGLHDGRMQLALNADPEMESNLEKCMVVETLEPRATGAALENFKEVWPNTQGLVALSRMKFLVVFGSMVEVEEVCRSDVAQIANAAKVRAWRPYDQVERRVTTITIRGLPFQAWNHDNIAKIARIVGDVQKIHDDEAESMENAEVHITIETSTLTLINKAITAVVGNIRFQVAIVEEGRADLREDGKTVIHRLFSCHRMLRRLVSK